MEAVPYGFRIVMSIDPVEKTDRFVARMRQITIEKMIQNTRIGLANMTEFQAELAFGFSDRAAFPEDHIQDAHQPGAIGPRFAMQHHRIFNGLQQLFRCVNGVWIRRLPGFQGKIDQLNAMSRAGLSLQTVATTIPVAAEVDDRFAPSASKSANLVRRRLAAPPDHRR